MIDFFSYEELPPTLYSIMKSICYGKEVPIQDLPKKTRAEIFDFDYSLTDKMDKETFEEMFLLHFIDRRIGFETFLRFKIHLMDKLNSNISKYNSIIESLLTDNILSPEDVHSIVETVDNTSNTTAITDSDVKYSDVPQNRLENVKNGAYVSEYTSNGGSSESTGESSSTRKLLEKNARADRSKVEMLIVAQKELSSELEYIWQDMDDLFYQLF